MRTTASFSAHTSDWAKPRCRVDKDSPAEEWHSRAKLNAELALGGGLPTLNIILSGIEVSGIETDEEGFPLHITRSEILASFRLEADDLRDLARVILAALGDRGEAA